MKTRIFRVLVCFALVCALLISISPIKAKAAGMEAALLSGNPYVIAAAAVICLGVMANPDSPEMFTNLVNDAGEVVTTLGAEVLRVVDDAGKAIYYASAELLEGVRSWLFESDVVVAPFTSYSAGSAMTMLDGTVLVPSAECISFVVSYSDGDYVYEIFYLPNVGSICNESTGKNKSLNSVLIDGKYHYYYSMSHLDDTYAQCAGIIWPDHGDAGLIRDVISAYLADDFDVASVVSEGLTAGVIPAVPIDGSSALKWSEEYADRQLRVIPANGSDDPDDSGGDGDNGGVWFPLALAGSITEIITHTQKDQWSADTPSEFPDAEVITEFEILSTPEIDGYQGIEISPVTDPSQNPGTGTDPGTDTDPEIGGSPGTSTNPDSGSDSGSDSDTDGNSPSDTDYSMDLTAFFPFCLPFDIYEFFSLLAADPVAPVFEWVIPVPQADAQFPITIDLSAWDTVAELFRTFELLAFIVGLAIMTRDKFLRG